MIKLAHLEPTVNGFITMLIAKITQYDQKQALKDPYHNSNFMPIAFGAVDQHITQKFKKKGLINSSDPKDLIELKQLIPTVIFIKRVVNPVIRAIDAYLEKGKLPRYPVTSATRKRRKTMRSANGMRFASPRPTPAGAWEEFDEDVSEEWLHRSKQDALFSGDFDTAMSMTKNHNAKEVIMEMKDMYNRRIRSASRTADVFAPKSLEKRARLSTVEGLKKGFSEAKVKLWKYGQPVPLKDYIQFKENTSAPSVMNVGSLDFQLQVIFQYDLFYRIMNRVAFVDRETMDEAIVKGIENSMSRYVPKAGGFYRMTNPQRNGLAGITYLQSDLDDLS